MTVKERILSIRLLEHKENNSEYMNRIGITSTPHETSNAPEDCDNFKGVKKDDKQH